ncbi:MAG: phosphoglycerate kinase [Victivallaceae bacterium]|nr:phosphoglycerate kinase [Victivallaceae bacterium]MDD3115848.1 phosphoglycerate kinase [Victivallaceae bacterium]MDD3702745.1 phosphoglycerate kinase [Victivallaceae bacterium]MDD4317532.1 phosphoglycerate kinase [Victivallaceae bacterium]MDD5662773.1 phosphoglycerate kinase [Victivallaceae bacterium]
MNIDKKTVRDLELNGKRVVMRVDFNVPIKDGAVADATRIAAALPSIRYIIEHGASLVLLTHLGRPKGEVNPEFSVKPAADYLAKLLGKPVKFASDCIGDEIVAQAECLAAGEVMVCENTRFHKAEDLKCKTPEDKESVRKFAAELAKLGEIYVNDAFGTAHRAHASTAVITEFMDKANCVAGFLMDKELQYLGKAVANPKKPFVAIIGGAKVSGKLEVLSALMEKVDTILIGGGMAYTFRKAEGHNIANSLCEDDLLDVARATLAKAAEKKVKFMLPLDNVAAKEFNNDAERMVCGNDIPDGYMALDIGPKTVQAYAAEIAQAKTVVWNGPMGCFEMSNFAAGTMGICKAVADADCVSIIGGGDSVAAVNKSGLADKMSHISTGGGASLEFLEGKVLPGVACLADA